MRALSIRQPYAELILPGIKPIEFRSRPNDSPAPWMLELANMLILKDLPTVVILGTASIKEVGKGPSARSTSSGRASSGQALYEWHLTDVKRAKRFRASANRLTSMSLSRIELVEVSRFGLRRFRSGNTPGASRQQTA